jgi:hypothetical protein
MAQIFLTDINLSKNELQNAAIQNLATAPASPVAGQIYFDTADAEMKVWDGSAWIGMGGDITSITAGAGLTGTAVSGDVTLDVGAGNGITVNADSIDVRYDNTSIELDAAGDLSLKATGVTADTYGDALGTSFPVITVDADGRITSAQSVGLSTSLAVAGDIADGGDMNIDLGSETLTINGSPDAIEVVAGYNTTDSLLYVGLRSNVSISSSLAVGSSFNTDSSTTNIGSDGQDYGTNVFGAFGVVDYGLTRFSVGPANVQVGSGTNSMDLIVYGDLTVSGTTTTVNTETINLADNIITLNSNATGTATENAGIEVERGDDANVSLYWDETNDVWTVDGNTIVDSANIGSFGVSSVELGTTTTGVTVTPVAASQGAVSATVDVDSASQASQGLIEIATDGEALAGTDDLKAITPLTTNLVANAIVNSKRLSRDLDSTDPLVSLDGTGTIYTVTHAMSTHDIIVQIYDLSTYETVYADVVRDAVNLDIVYIKFASAPGDGAYRVSIIKA